MKMKEEIIQRGAEAVIIKKDNLVLKRREKKGYRIEELDVKLRKRRTKKEGKILEKVSKVIKVPKVSKVDNKEMEIDMEFISGKKLSEELDSLKEWKEVCFKIGESIGKLHDFGVIHGDLTTSNMIFNDSVYFIDFGLGYESDKIEDKAVDLHLIKQALEAKHFGNYEKFFKEVIEGYRTSKNAESVLKRLEKVEMRGRYKQQY